MQKLINSRKKLLLFYSPYHFLKGLDADSVINEFVNNIKIDPNIRICIEKTEFIFIIKYLDWDSCFFKIPIFKIETILYATDNIQLLIKAIHTFYAQHTEKDAYYYIEIPSEDIFLIQALGVCGFKLIETRLNLYLTNLKKYNYTRFKTRNATDFDIKTLRKVAVENKNVYDRFHADTYFDSRTADEYLGQYTENAIKGFCDFVIIPNENGVNQKAFMAVSYLQKSFAALNCKIARLKLAAVDPTCKGWYIKLTSEAIYKCIEEGADHVLLTTQSTNKAAIVSCEKLGFKIGSLSHVFSKKNND